MINKIVHISWKTDSVLSSDSALPVLGIQRLKKLNPTWDIQLSNDEQVTEYLRKTLGFNEFKLLENTHIVAKLDIWRLCKLYLEGGLYVDIDRLCNKSLDSLAANYSWILPYCNNWDFSHDFMMSDSNNPILLDVLQTSLYRRSLGFDHLYLLGPQTYMNCLSRYFIGKELQPGPESKDLLDLRAAVAEHKNIYTYIETSPLDTVIYDNEENLQLEDLERIKRQFYAEENIKHWTQEW